MNIVCKNCGHEFEGLYCNNCGQEASTPTLNSKYLWREIRLGLFHLDQGLFFSIKELFIRPGNSIREFIEGKRVKHLKPLSLIILVASTYALLYHYFQIGLHTESNAEIDRKDSLDSTFINEWLVNHISAINLLALPFYALASFLAFKKQGYNFVEHLVLNTYLASQRICASIICFPILYYSNKNQNLSTYNSIILIIDAILMVWTFCQFFNKLAVFKSVLLSLLSYLIFWACLLIVISLGLAIFSYLR